MIAIPMANFASDGSECSHSQAIVKKLIDWFLQGEILLLVVVHAEMAVATVRKRILNLLRVCLSLVCRRGLRRPTEIINQDIDADQEHPQREDQ